MARTADGKSFWMLNIIDEYARECLAIDVKRKITSQDVVDRLFYLIFLTTSSKCKNIRCLRHNIEAPETGIEKLKDQTILRLFARI